MNTITPVQPTAVDYDGREVRVSWPPVASAEGVVGYVVVVACEGTGIAYSQQFDGAPASYGAIKLPGPLDATALHWVRVDVATVVGLSVPGIRVPLPAARPMLRGGAYGSRWIDLEWHPAASAAGGYLLKVFSKGALYTAQVDDPYATTGRIGPDDLPEDGLDPAQPWSVSVSAIGEAGATASSDPVPLLGSLPQFTYFHAEYQGGARVVADWAPLASSDVAAYVLEASSPQTGARHRVRIPGAPSSAVVLPLPAPLAADVAWELSLTAEMDGGIGARMAPVAVMASLPAIRRLDYDGQSVALAWTAPAGTVTGYVLKVVSGGQAWTAEAKPGSLSGTVETGPLEAGRTYLATVSATGADGVQSASPAVTVPATRPAVAAIRYDTRSIAVAWTGAEAGGLVGYRLTRTVDGQAVQQAGVGDPLATTAVLALDAPLDPARANAVQVAALYGGGVAVLGDIVAVPASIPILGYGLYDGGRVEVSWEPQAVADGYRLAVVAANGEVIADKTVNGGPANYAELPLPGPLSPGRGWTLALDVLSDGGIVRGGPAGTLATALPVVVMAQRRMAEVTLEWLPYTDTMAVVTGYLATVVDGSTGDTWTKEVKDPYATRAVVPVAMVLPPHPYEAYVIALSTNGIGARGPAVRVGPPLPPDEDGDEAASATASA